MFRVMPQELLIGLFLQRVSSYGAFRLKSIAGFNHHAGGVIGKERDSLCNTFIGSQTEYRLQSARRCQ